VDEGKSRRNGSLLSKEERLRLILTHREDVNPDLLLSVEEVMVLLNCSVSSLEIGRKDGRRKGKILGQDDLPPHKVLFETLIRYRYGDLMEWVKRRDAKKAA
jgi:hypothetical protein